GRVDVVTVRADGLGGGGNLVGRAVVGGDLGVHLDLRVGGQALAPGGVVQVVELGQVGGVHLVLEDEDIGVGGGRAGHVATDEPVVKVLTRQLRTGGAGHLGQVTSGRLDNVVPVGVGKLAEQFHVQCRVLLLTDRRLGPHLRVVEHPLVVGADRPVLQVGRELGVGGVGKHAIGAVPIADRVTGRVGAGAVRSVGVEEVAGGRRIYL